MDYGKHFKDRMMQTEYSALMAKMEADEREIARLREIVADCRDAAGFGTEHDPMEAEGFAALGEPIEVPAFIEKQFKRLRADLAEEKLEHHHYRALAAHAEEARKQAQIDKQKAIEARNRSALDVRRDEVAPLQAKLATEKTKHHYTALAAHAEAQEVNRLNAELAAAQAREEKLRDALMDGVAHLAAAVSAYEKFVGRADRRGQRDPFFSTRFSDFTKAEERTRETLSLPHDDSALKERLAKERERCAEECDRRYYDQGHECAAAIRAMGESCS